MPSNAQENSQSPETSIIIRTLNESRWLNELLLGIKTQKNCGKIEVIIVNSGSIDRTIEIAQNNNARILKIDKSEFSFGRSLNVGCSSARGQYLVFISGHCIPYDRQWLNRLISPLKAGKCTYAYGRQVGNSSSRYSELRLFNKYFPENPANAQGGNFCNNANAALVASEWRRFRFDEELTGLEDMDLAKRLIANGQKIQYVCDSIVYHLHDERWSQIRRRYEREAIALQKIAPEFHITFHDFVRFLTSAIMLDASSAARDGVLIRRFYEIFMFRLMQFYGSYRGNQIHRVLSHQAKERYFYAGT